jgi:hypothetical protein
VVGVEVAMTTGESLEPDGKVVLGSLDGAKLGVGLIFSGIGDTEGDDWVGSTDGTACSRLASAVGRSVGLTLGIGLLTSMDGTMLEGRISSISEGSALIRLVEGVAIGLLAVVGRGGKDETVEGRGVAVGHVGTAEFPGLGKAVFVGVALCVGAIVFEGLSAGEDVKVGDWLPAGALVVEEDGNEIGLSVGTMVKSLVGPAVGAFVTVGPGDVVGLFVDMATKDVGLLVGVFVSEVAGETLGIPVSKGGKLLEGATVSSLASGTEGWIVGKAIKEGARLFVGAIVSDGERETEGVRVV